MKLAPTPPAEPIFGHARALARSPLRTLLGWMSEHGPIVRFRVGSRDAHVVFAPDAIRHVLSDPEGIYGKDTHGYRTLRLFTGDGLLTNDDRTAWARQRRILQPAFHRQSITGQTNMMRDVAERWADVLAATDGRPVRIDDVAMRTTLEIVSRALFGADLASDASEVSAAIADLQVAANRRISTAFALPFCLPSPEHLRIRRARSRLRRILARLVNERRVARGEHRSAPDVIDLLLAARVEETGEPLSLETILDELVTLLIAGHESTSNALTWAIVLLARHPAEAAAMRAELGAVPDGGVTAERLVHLPRSRAVIDETMRLYPPAWSFGRAPRRDDVIVGCSVPAGRLVMIAPWATHRDRSLFPQPEAFDPSRFIGRTPPAFSYLPFGAGARTCIGHAFARAEAQIVLSTWLGRLDFELLPGQDLEPAPLVTLRPRDGVLVSASRRQR